VHAGLSRLRVAVLRCAELYAPDGGGPLCSWLRSLLCLRPLGFDPVVNLLSAADLVSALALAVRSPAPGIFNVPGADTLPLSELAERCGRLSAPVAGFLLPPLYALLPGTAFRYGPNQRRLHFGGVLCGEAAQRVLGYRPRTGIRFPAEPWPRLPIALEGQPGVSGR